MSWRLAILPCVICFLVGLQGGLILGYIEIANECKRLGSFYIGGSVFKCVEFPSAMIDGIIMAKQEDLWKIYPLRMYLVLAL